MGYDAGSYEGIDAQKREYMYKRLIAARPDFATRVDLLTDFSALELEYYRGVNDGSINELSPQKRLSGGLYLPTEYAMLKWRALRAKTIVGERQGHIAILGDSIPYGAGTGAVSSPKPQNNWVGRLRKQVVSRFGDSGSGIVFAEANKLTNPSWDPRWALTGDVTNFAMGLYKGCSFRVNSIAGSYIEFTDKADTFVVYNYGSNALNTVSVDGSTVGTIRNAGGSGGAASSIPKQAGYWVSQVVSEVSAGTYGTHTLRITPDTTVDTNDIFLGGIEARKTVNGTFRVTEAAKSSMSFADLFSRSGYNDETNGIYGLPMIDMMRADILVLALGINDWNGSRTLADTKADVKAAIRRQRSTTAASGTIGQAAGGDVLLVWNPAPDMNTIGLTATAKYTDFRDMYYDVAREENCALLDLTDRWGGYASGNGLGLYADGIHPNDSGSIDISSVVYRALFDFA